MDDYTDNYADGMDDADDTADETGETPLESEDEPSTVDADVMNGFMDGEYDESAADMASAANRWGVRTELVTRVSAPISARLKPSDLPIHARIVLPALPVGSGVDLQTYEAAAGGLETEYPLRVARLRDLFRRMEQARVNMTELYERAEQERVNINEFNNAINGRAEDEAALLRKRLQEVLNERFGKIRAAKEVIAEREAAIGKEIVNAQSEYWAVHSAHSKARDEAAKTQNEAAREKADQAENEARREAEALQDVQNRARSDRQTQQEASDKARRDALQAEWETKHTAAGAAREAALAAEEAAHKAEQEAFMRLQGVLDESCAACRQSLLEAGEKAEIYQAQAKEGERKSLSELLALCDTRRQFVQTTVGEANAERKHREAEVTEAQKHLSRTAAQAGLLPAEATPNTTSAQLQEAFFRKLLEEAAAGGVSATRHVTEDAPKSKLLRVWEGALEFFALVACGGVFGLSLGIITGVMNLTLLLHAENAAEQAAALGIFAGLIFLGTALFYVMGRVSEHAAAYASEELNADAERHERGAAGFPRGLLAAVLTGAVLAALLIIEIIVEKKGIVKAAINISDSTNPVNENEWSFWVLAAVLSVPFIAYHAYRGAKEARLRLANRRRDENFAQIKQDYLARPSVQAVSEALQNAHDVHVRLDTFDTETAPVKEARAALMQAQNELQAHRETMSGTDWNTQKENWMHGDSAIRQTDLVHEAVRQQVQNDPAVQVASARAEALTQAAQKTEADEEKAFAALHANHDLRRAARDFGAGFVDGIASSAENALQTLTSGETGQSLGENAAQFASTAAARQAVPLQTSALWQAVQAVSRRVWEQERAHSPTDADVSEEEKFAHLKVEAVRARLTSDPEIRRQWLRIKEWQKEIRDWRKQTDRSIRRLRAQKGQVQVKMDDAAILRVEEARKDWEAATMLWEEEFAFFQRLYAAPKMLRPLVNWTQSHQSRLPVLRRMHEARRAATAQESFLPVSGKL